MDERLAQLLDQAIDHFPDYDLDAEDCLIVTRVSLRAFLTYIEYANPDNTQMKACIEAILMAIPIDD